jgi:hypothetical protein
MKFKIDFKSLDWWYWFITLIAMTVGLTGIVEGFYAVILVSIIQFVHFTISRGFVAFPTQIRFVYGIFVIVAMYDPTRIFFWLLMIGTVMVTLFDTCFIARLLIFMPWNKNIKLT